MIWIALLSSAGAELNPRGTVIDEAIVVDIPPQGLTELAGFVPALIPSPIDVPQLVEEGAACWPSGYWYKFVFKNAWADIQLLNAELVPQDGYIDVNIDLEVTINDPADNFDFNYYIACAKSECDGYVDPFVASVTGTLSIELKDEDGDGVQEADVQLADTLSISYDLDADNDIHMSNCPVSGLEDLFDFFGGSLYGLILDSIDLEAILGDALPELETTIEEALSSANIEQSFEVGGALLDVQIAPNDIIIQESGLRLALSGMTSAMPEQCVQRYDPAGSKKTTNAMSDLTMFPSDYQVGLMVSDDFLNQALYSTWSGGLLCQTIDEDIFAVDTSILNLLTDDAFEGLFPETSPMIIKTQPKFPMELNMDTASAMAIDIEEMGLDFFADVDGRQTRILSVDITTDVGVDLLLDGTTGALDIGIDVDPARVASQVSTNEFLPGQDDAIESSFVSQLGTILGLIDIEGLLGDLGLVMPSLPSGDAFFGIEEFNIAPSGTQNEDLGMYVSVGTVPYNGCAASSSGEGCAGDLGAGCDTDASSCEGGCSTNGRPNGRVFLLGFVFCLGLLRRKDS